MNKNHTLTDRDDYTFILHKLIVYLVDNPQVESDQRLHTGCRLSAGQLQNSRSDNNISQSNAKSVKLLENEIK